MADPFVGEIRMFGGTFAPVNWAFCNGQILSIEQNTALFTLLGTTYGGDGETTFALPDLRGRLPLHQGTDPSSGSTFVIGQLAGREAVTLTAANLPTHAHPLLASTANSSLSTPIGNMTADTTSAGANIYGPVTSPAPLAPTAVGSSGNNQPHENRMPFLAVNFIISLFGVYPSRN